jgi:hypothetical protein
MTHVAFATSPSSRTAQHGAALVVGLVLMLVLTVLGVSGMNTATLELVMANNNQSQQLAFQAAETGIDLAVGNGTYLTSVPTNFAAGDSRAVMSCVTTTPVPDIAFSIGAPAGGARRITSTSSRWAQARETPSRLITRAFTSSAPAAPPVADTE